MARIRHIAIGTDDPEATAKFYMEGLGLQQVGRVGAHDDLSAAPPLHPRD